MTAGVTRPLFPFLRKVRCLGIVKVLVPSGQQVDERKLWLVKMWWKKEQMLVSGLRWLLEEEGTGRSIGCRWLSEEVGIGEGQVKWLIGSVTIALVNRVYGSCEIVNVYTLKNSLWIIARIAAHYAHRHSCTSSCSSQRFSCSSVCLLQRISARICAGGSQQRQVYEAEYNQSTAFITHCRPDTSAICSRP